MLDTSDEEITVMPNDRHEGRFGLLDCSDEEADMKDGPDCWTAVMRRQT